VKPLPVIVNPIARGGRAPLPKDGLEGIARRHGLALEWHPTQAPGHATELARRAVRDGCPIVAVWGGDGTYNEVARALLGSDTSLLILPGGTTSVLAFELGIPRRPVAALEAQLAGVRRAMSVGLTDRGQSFLLMLSVGPDSLILANLPTLLKVRAGKVGIAIQAFVECARARLPRFQVESEPLTAQASWCIVGNGRCYGGPYHATPGADPFAPGFELLVLERPGRRAVIPFFFAIPSGRHLHLRGVSRASAREVRLLGENGIPYQLDGDPAGTLPVAVRTAPERLWVMVPTGRPASPSA
jgi:diacylglycerol kinase (ATP)